MSEAVETTDAQEDKRDDEEVMLRELLVTLGGEQHAITVKSIKESRDYRRVLARVMRKLIVPLINLEDLERADFQQLAGVGLEAVLVDGLDAFPGMLAAYAPELNGQIEAATDEEIVEAMSEVLEVTFPLVVSVTRLAFKLMSGSDMFAQMMKAQGVTKMVSPSAPR